MKINLKETIKSLKGEAILKDDKTEFTVGEALANVLISAQIGGKMKLFILAQKMFNDNSIELDNADFSLVKKMVADSNSYGALVLGQLELLLEKKAE